jgi:group I intron endonuclease
MSKSKYYFVYKTTCIPTGLIYVGSHRTNDLEDGYIGYGISLRRKKARKSKSRFVAAYNEYGYENFTREILEFCDSFDLMAETEEKWQTSLNCTDPAIGYNAMITGTGGHKEEYFHDENVRKKIAGREYSTGADHPLFEKGHTAKSKLKMSESAKNRIRTQEERDAAAARLRSVPNYWLSHEMTAEMRLNMKLAAEKRERGVCKWCGKECDVSNLGKWHNDNCKHNPKNIK